MKLFFIFLLGLSINAFSAPAKKSHLEFYDNIPIIHLYGTPEKMAKDYAKLVKKPFVSAISLLKMFCHKRLPGYYQRTKRLEPALPKHIKQEMRILSNITGLSYEDVSTVNIASEIQCSTISVWGNNSKNNKLIMGRNLDYNIGPLSNIAGLVTVYHYETGNQVIAINFLGMIGCFTGLNSKNVCFGNMVIDNAKNDTLNKDGLAIQLILRETARKANNSAIFAKQLSKQYPNSPMNVMVADEKEAFVVEMGVNDSAIRNGRKNNYIFASNHFRTNKMASHPISCHRYKTLNKYTLKHLKSFTIKDMKNVVAKARIPNINIQAAIFVPEDSKLYLSMNAKNASLVPYTIFDTKKLFADKGNPVIKLGGPSANSEFLKTLYKEFE